LPDGAPPPRNGERATGGEHHLGCRRFRQISADARRESCTHTSSPTKLRLIGIFFLTIVVFLALVAAFRVSVIIRQSDSGFFAWVLTFLA